jgi:dihydrofolate reductase
MRTIILIVHLSLDGYVAGPQGDLNYFNPSDENLAFVNSLTTNADAALFGRNSYKLLNDFWPSMHKDPQATAAEVAYSNWYNTAQKIVVSNTLPDRGENRIAIISKYSEAELLKIKQQPGKNILIFGSPSLSETLMRDDLIDEFWVFIHPVFFGKGLPLFTDLPEKTELELLEMHSLPHNQIALHYIKKAK